MEFMKKAFLSRRSISQKSFFLIYLFFLLALNGTALSQTVTITTQVLIDLEEEASSPSPISSSFQEITLSASPSLIEIEQIGGGIRNFTINLSNSSQEQIQVKTMVLDITQSSVGKIELVDAGTTSYSLASWLISKGEENLILAPGEVKKVPFQLTVPPGEKGGRYGAITFEAFHTIIPQGEVLLGIHSETPIYLTILHTEEYLGNIEDITIVHGKEFKVTFKNSGNIYYQAKGNLVIKNEEGSVLQGVQFPEDKPYLIFPQVTKDFIIPWNKIVPLSEGNYLLEVQMMAVVGNCLMDIERKEDKFEVINPNI